MRVEMRFIFWVGIIWLLPLVTPAHESNATSPLLTHLKGKLDAELRAIDISPAHFDERRFLELQADAASLRDRFGRDYVADHFGDTATTVEINLPFHIIACYMRFIPCGAPLQRRDYKWAACEATSIDSSYFLQCSLKKGATPLQQVLAFVRVAVKAKSDRGICLPAAEANVTNYSERYLVRPISAEQEWRYLVCPWKDAYCDINVHIRQIPSLGAFEAQLERIAELMEDVELEERRLLDAEAASNGRPSASTSKSSNGAKATKEYEARLSFLTFVLGSAFFFVIISVTLKCMLYCMRP